MLDTATTLPAPTSRALRGLVLLAACLVAGAAQAQSNWYAIEVVVFAHTGDGGRGAEAWRADPGVPDRSRAQAISAGGAVARVNPSAYRLSGIWAALKASSGYRPLRHLAWTQRGASQASAPEVLVGELPGDEIEGVIQISRSRFLHAKVDLVYRDGLGSYRLTTRRRMRSNELHYLDHPLFALVIIATPLGN